MKAQTGVRAARTWGRTLDLIGSDQSMIGCPVYLTLNDKSLPPHHSIYPHINRTYIYMIFVCIYYIYLLFIKIHSHCGMSTSNHNSINIFLTLGYTNPVLLHVFWYLYHSLEIVLGDTADLVATETVDVPSSRSWITCATQIDYL